MQFKDLKLLQLNAVVKRNVFSLDLKEVRVGADLQFSGSLFQICGS